MVRHLLTTACVLALSISPVIAQTDDGYEQFVGTLGVLGVSTPDFALAQTALGPLLGWGAWTLALIPAIEVAFEREDATDVRVSARVDVGGDFGLGDALPLDHYQDHGAALAVSIAHLGLGPRNILLEGTLLDGPDLFGWGIGIGLES